MPSEPGKMGQDAVQDQSPDHQNAGRLAFASAGCLFRSAFTTEHQLHMPCWCTAGRSIDHAARHSVPRSGELSSCSSKWGAKKGSHDAVRIKVAEALHEHGVAKETCHDRAAAFLAKADVETVSKIDSSDAEKFWKAVKDEANRVHFRLVFRKEMLAAKQEGRKKPPAKFNKKTKVPPKPEEFVANATNVVIDMKHFWDGDENIEMIENSRFGHDQRGLAVMELDEADRHTSGSSLSADPLAILVVGRKFASHDMPFAMPAHTHEGEPVVIHAALRQFGDRPVTFKAAIPSTKVECMASTVVEMHIFKDEVAVWKECSVPLHYLGVHISAARGSSLLSTWSMRTWSNARQPVPFRDAAYWHGYIRVPDRDP